MRRGSRGPSLQLLAWERKLTDRIPIGSSTSPMRGLVDRREQASGHFSNVVVNPQSTATQAQRVDVGDRPAIDDLAQR